MQKYRDHTLHGFRRKVFFVPGFRSDGSLPRRTRHAGQRDRHHSRNSPKFIVPLNDTYRQERYHNDANLLVFHRSVCVCVLGMYPYVCIGSSSREN